jgi:AcrR family transcriptional regulator
MRQIAQEAGLSLGAAYHHFDGKQAIVFAYYAQQQQAHEAAAREAMAEASSLRERLGLVMHTALDVRGMDRALMRELAPMVVGPDESTSAFSERTARLRERSIALWREAVEDDAVPADQRQVLALALWALQMGLMLYFAHDDSPRQRKTRALVDGSLDLVVTVAQAMATPMLAPLAERLRSVLSEAGLLS